MRDDRPRVQLQFIDMSMKKAHGLLGIEMRHLVAFEAVVETGSFARAAGQLGYTQSAVSLQIAALERAAGTRLLVRPGGRRPVVTTDAGARMLRHAARLSAQLQAAQADLTALAEGTANTLRVGTFQSVSISVLPDAVRALIESHPGIEVQLHEESWDHDLLGQVERGELDLTFAVVPPEGPFEHVELLRDPYVLLTQVGSPLAERGTVPTLVEIGRMPLIAYSRSTYGVEGLLRSRGIEPNVVFRSDESGAVQRLVAAGIGSALVARLSVDAGIPGVVVLDASRRVPARRIGLVWHRDVELSAAALTFVAAAKARCDELAADDADLASARVA
jgi:DNA-binding transcriptional LysR family regulator